MADAPRIPCTFTKSAHPKITVVAIWFPMRCNSVGHGMSGRVPLAMQIGYAQHCSRSHDVVICI